MSERSVAFQSFIGVDLHKTTVTLVAVDAEGRRPRATDDHHQVPRQNRPLAVGPAAPLSPGRRGLSVRRVVHRRLPPVRRSHRHRRRHRTGQPTRQTTEERPQRRPRHRPTPGPRRMSAGLHRRRRTRCNSASSAGTGDNSADCSAAASTPCGRCSWPPTSPARSSTAPAAQRWLSGPRTPAQAGPTAGLRQLPRHRPTGRTATRAAAARHHSWPTAPNASPTTKLLLKSVPGIDEIWAASSPPKSDPSTAFPTPTPWSSGPE